MLPEVAEPLLTALCMKWLSWAACKCIAPWCSLPLLIPQAHSGSVCSTAKPEQLLSSVALSAHAQAAMKMLGENIQAGRDQGTHDCAGRACLINTTTRFFSQAQAPQLLPINVCIIIGMPCQPQCTATLTCGSGTLVTTATSGTATRVCGKTISGMAEYSAGWQAIWH